MRGACSLRDDRIEGAWRRLSSNSAPAMRSLNFVNGAELAPLQPGGRGHARSHHPHQELAADSAGAGGRKARGLPPRAEQAAADFIAHYNAYFARNNARAGGTKAMLDPLPRVVLVPGLGLFGLGRIAQGRARRRRSCRIRHRHHHRCRGDRPLRVDFRSRHVRHGILVARAGKARRRRRTSRSPARSRPSPAPAAPSARAAAKAFAAAGAEVALLDVDLAAAIEQRQGDRRSRARGASAT